MRGDLRKKKWLWFVIPVAVVGFVTLAGWVVMSLWNALLPAIFGWKIISFWQAVGLLLLSRILFGHHGPHQARHWKERHDWKNSFTPEERERFRQEMRRRWCGEEPAQNGGPTA